MNFMTTSRDDQKRLFVPINEFEFNSFTVRVRRLVPRQARAPESVFRIARRQSNTLWTMSPIKAAV